jgi:hypothetical protein
MRTHYSSFKIYVWFDEYMYDGISIDLFLKVKYYLCILHIHVRDQMEKITEEKMTLDHGEILQYCSHLLHTLFNVSFRIRVASGLVGIKCVTTTPPA